MSLSHSPHDHHHHPHGAPDSFGRAFAIAIVLNTAFVAIEFGYGFASGSMALVADAGHNLSDVLSLIMAWGAMLLARRRPEGRYTYGLRSSSILAALLNAMLLLVACGAMAWEALERFHEPPVVAGLTVTVVAAVGIFINGLSAWLFMRGSQHDLNIRGAYLHMAADAVVSLAVVITGLGMFYSGWYWLDPVISLVIVGVIVWGTWGLLRESLRLAMSAVPAGVDVAEIERFLRALPGVSEIHDLHIWGLSTTETALTVHLVMPAGYPGDAFLEKVVEELEHHYAIRHSTVQIEQGTIHHACTLAGHHAH
ncbi:MAG: cation transporter [Moraxellaceae bacterium]|jgi:cobalt-zinc-cadmium efflux system protein|nr:cation transporter [Moraxellaceae bacterium]